MTISSTARKAGPFAGNATATVFPFAFKIFSKADIKVLSIDANSVSTTLTLDSDYSVSLNANQDANPGGTVSYPLVGAPLAVGSSLVVLGNVLNDQLTEITNNGGFYPQTIEDMSDKSTIQIQQLAEVLSRALVVTEAESAVAPLPIAPNRANRALVFDSNGAPGVSAGPYLDSAGILQEAIDAANAIVASITTPTFQSFVPLVLRDGTDYVSGTSQSVTLPATVSGKVISGVFMAGTFQSSTQYTLNPAGTLLTFSSVIPLGVSEINVMYFSPSLMGLFLQMGYGAISRPFQDKMRETVSVEDFGAKGDGVTDDSAAIQAAINWVASIGGGDIYHQNKTYAIAYGLSITKSNVRLRGKGGNTYHDGGSGALNGTTYKWIGATAGPGMLNIQTPRSLTGAIQSGQAVTDIVFDGNFVAAGGLLITSIRNGRFENLHVMNVVSFAYYITTYARSTMAEASDTQECTWRRCTWRMVDVPAVQNANGFTLTAEFGNLTALANSCFNTIENCSGQCYNGTCWTLGDCDNNTLIGCRAFRVGGTAQPGMLLQGDSNYFWGFSVSGANGIVLPVPGAGGITVSHNNTFFNVDVGNGTQYPVLGVGATVGWHTSSGTFTQLRSAQLSAARTESSALAEMANLGSTSLNLHNDSSNHMRITDGTNVWNINIDGTTGNLRIRRASGSGTLDLQSTSATSATAGTASALPATPAEYETVYFNGVAKKIPTYNL